MWVPSRWMRRFLAFRGLDEPFHSGETRGHETPPQTPKQREGLDYYYLPKLCGQLNGPHSYLRWSSSTHASSGQKKAPRTSGPPRWSAYRFRPVPSRSVPIRSATFRSDAPATPRYVRRIPPPPPPRAGGAGPAGASRKIRAHLIAAGASRKIRAHLSPFRSVAFRKVSQVS